MRNLAQPEQEKGIRRERNVRREKALESGTLGKMVMRWAALDQNKKEKTRERAQDWIQGATHPPHNPLRLSSPVSPLSSPPFPPFLSRKECLVSSSGNDNTENGLPGSKAEEKPPTKV